MVQHPEPKKAVALIRQTFADQGVKLQTKAAYHLLAQLWGYKDWPTYCGMNAIKAEPPVPAALPFARGATELEGWHTWVVLMRWGDEGDELFLLPYGATLEDRYAGRNSWQLVNDDDAVPFTVGFTDPQEKRDSWQDLVVVTEVASQYPRADRYGFPEFSNDREVGKWAERELGWGYLAASPDLPLVEVVASESGDDSSAVWWAQVLVHPTAHERLLTQFGLGTEFDAVWPQVILDEPYTVKQDDPSYDPRVVSLRKSLGAVFADLDGQALGAVMEALEEPTDSPAEDFLREQLANELITLNGQFLPLTAHELKERLNGYIAAAETSRS